MGQHSSEEQGVTYEAWFCPLSWGLWVMWCDERGWPLGVRAVFTPIKNRTGVPSVCSPEPAPVKGGLLASSPPLSDAAGRVGGRAAGRAPDGPPRDAVYCTNWPRRGSGSAASYRDGG